MAHLVELCDQTRLLGQSGPTPYSILCIKKAAVQCDPDPARTFEATYVDLLQVIGRKLHMVQTQLLKQQSSSGHGSGTWRFLCVCALMEGRRSPAAPGSTWKNGVLFMRYPEWQSCYCIIKGATCSNEDTKYQERLVQSPSEAMKP